MSRHPHVSILALFLWSLLILAPTACSAIPISADSGVTIAGSVVDASLAPLSGVSVTLERGGKVEAKTTTDAEGTFSFAGVAPGEYRVRADRAGFPPFSRTLRVPATVSHLQFPIVLTRPGDTRPEAKPEGAPQAGAVGGVVPPSAPPVRQTGAAGRGGSPSTTKDSLMAIGQMPTSSGIVAGSPQGFVREPFDEYVPYSREGYAHVEPGRFHRTRDEPLSTFGADVDTASYTNIRRFLSSGQVPPPDAVRIEELLNYFRFPYAEPHGNELVGLTTEIGNCPWEPAHRLVLIGARAKTEAPRDVEGRNLVLLIDVSGSMAPPDRLPLIKSALSLFVDTLRPDDRLAIVTYAGTSGVALPSTPARHKDVILHAIDGLSAGGSTNGGQGLILAYRTAREAFIPGGVNRVILATDGDFNVGIVNRHDLLHLIEQEKASGVFLSVFGVGRGNLQDSTMEMLADRGNGHYAYLDSLQEARRVLVREGDATLETVAKDVKFQVEFNPAAVAAWKLIGYENRRLAAPEFNDDRKDGGEMGAGHTVTVLYEVVPAGSMSPEDDRSAGHPSIDPYRYQQTASQPPRPELPHTGEWLTVKARYKAPEADDSRLIAQQVRAGQAVRHLPLAAAIAEFGLLLRDGRAVSEQWQRLARRVDALTVPPSLAADKASFAELVAIAAGLAKRARN